MYLSSMSATAFTIATLFSAILASDVPPSISPPNAETSWGQGSINSNGWVPVPGIQNTFAQVPTSTASAPYVYKYELACSTPDQSLFPACAANAPKCDEAKDGVAVYWYRSLAGAQPRTWTFDSGPSCIYSEKPIDVLAEIAARINSEFKKTPVKGATVASQPGPHTLRGSFNNFYANANTQDFDITLLGQKVHITATPVSYTWNYGDGQTMGPTDLAGAPLPEDRIGEQTLTSHAYQATGTFSITATTHFNGSYSVNGGPTLPIPEQGHIGSPPITVKVWRAVTKNYADNCLANPQGAGC